ncbi:MAG: hypothetical protein FWC58_03305 [Desulfobulbus sp.]|nr:hypothetical protein [Desulfobulbus sp.]
MMTLLRAVDDPRTVVVLRRVAPSAEYSAIREAWQGLSEKPGGVAGKVRQAAYTAAIAAQ